MLLPLSKLGNLELLEGYFQACVAKIINKLNKIKTSEKIQCFSLASSAVQSPKSFLSLSNSSYQNRHHVSRLPQLCFAQFQMEFNFLHTDNCNAVLAYHLISSFTSRLMLFIAILWSLPMLTRLKTDACDRAWLTDQDVILLLGLSSPWCFHLKHRVQSVHYVVYILNIDLSTSVHH